MAQLKTINIIDIKGLNDDEIIEVAQNLEDDDPSTLYFLVSFELQFSLEEQDNKTLLTLEIKDAEQSDFENFVYNLAYVPDYYDDLIIKVINADQYNTDKLEGFTIKEEK